MISETHRDLLNAPFNAQEILEAITTLKLNVAPGPDEFSSEYYKKCAEVLSPVLLEVFAEGTMSYQNHGGRLKLWYSLKTGMILRTLNCIDRYLY